MQRVLSANKPQEGKEEKVKEAPTPPAAGESSPKIRVAIASLKATGGALHVRDDLPAGGFRADLEDMEFTLDDFDTKGARPARWGVEFSSSRDEEVAVAGTLLPEPLELHADLSVTGADLAAYNPYLAATLTSPVSGRLDLAGAISYSKAEGLRVAGAKLSARNLALPFGNKEGVKLSSLAVSGGDIQLDKRTATVEQISIDNGDLRLSREADGTLSPLRVLRKESAPAVRGGRSAQKPAPPFKYRLRRVTGKGLAVAFTDRTKEEAPLFSLSRLNVSLENITGPTFGPIPFRLAAQYGAKGKISGKGTVTPDPFQFKGDLTVAALPLRDFDPYLPDNLAVSLADGYLDTTLSLSLKRQQNALTGNYRGSLGIRSFYSLDAEENEDLLKWESLQLDGMSGSIAPFSLDIRDVALNGAYARVIVGKDGTLNLQHLFTKEEPPAGTVKGGAPSVPAPAPAPPPPATAQAPPAASPAKGQAQVRIGAVTIQDGTLDFSDYHLEQGFSTTMYNLGGRVSGLSSEEQRFADVDLRGNLENHSPLRITGSINPLRDDLFIDLKVSFTDIDLSPATPYSGTYLGYTVDKGKLFLDLKYLIDKKQLNSENRIFIDQFTFGGKVDSDKATNLPVRLAVALLKDRKGEIHLDLPVTGQTDDPQFSIWGLIYVGLFAYAIFQSLPSQRSNPRLRAIGWPFVVSCVANILWLFFFQYSSNPDPQGSPNVALLIASVIAMLVILGSLITIYLRLRAGNPKITNGERWAVRLPFSMSPPPCMTWQSKRIQTSSCWAPMVSRGPRAGLLAAS